jgi:hypothetical protein
VGEEGHLQDVRERLVVRDDDDRGGGRERPSPLEVRSAEAQQAEDAWAIAFM